MRRKIAPADSYNDSSSMARQHIRRGTEISVYPELRGVRFNPPFANVLWLEDWHCIQFRMQAVESFGPSEGRVAFYVGPILIGETQLYASTTHEAEAMRKSPPQMIHFGRKRGHHRIAPFLFLTLTRTRISWIS